MVRTGSSMVGPNRSLQSRLREAPAAPPVKCPRSCRTNAWSRLSYNSQVACAMKSAAWSNRDSFIGAKYGMSTRLLIEPHRVPRLRNSLTQSLARASNRPSEKISSPRCGSLRSWKRLARKYRNACRPVRWQPPRRAPRRAPSPSRLPPRGASIRGCRWR